MERRSTRAWGSERGLEKGRCSREGARTSGGGAHLLEYLVEALNPLLNLLHHLVDLGLQLPRRAHRNLLPPSPGPPPPHLSPLPLILPPVQ